MSAVKSKVKQVGRIALLAVISLVIGLMLYGWNARTLGGNAMPMPFGFGTSVVLSGSMEPELSVDDLVFVRKADSYEIGDVVVYQSGSSLVIHKIIYMDEDQVITKGVKNNTPDDPIKRDAIKGKAVAHIPFVGMLVRLIKTPVGSILLILAAIVLFEWPYYKERKKALDEQEKIKEEIRKLKEQ